LKNVTSFIDWVPEIGDFYVNCFSKELKETMWENVGIVRSSNSLMKAKEKLEEIFFKLKKSKPNNLRNWIGCFNMVTVAQCITVSAEIRKESRGAHFRTDFHQGKEEFTGNIVFLNNEFKFVDRK